MRLHLTNDSSDRGLFWSEHLIPETYPAQHVAEAVNMWCRIHLSDFLIVQVTA
jgi:hypothetical protein